MNTGTSVTLNAEPAEGSVFAGWSAPRAGTSTCTVTVEQAISVNAEFGRPTFTRYLAEGATSAFLDTRIALLNHGATDAATTRILARAGDTAVMHDTVVPAHARVTFDPKTLAGFAAAEFSTTVVSDAPLVVDRTMSWDASGYGGHAETALTAPPASRTNIWVDAESFDGGTTFPLADVAVSTLPASSNGVPIIAERSLWWPGGFDNWHEAHNSAGATQAGTLWALAEGAVGGSRAEETYLLIANTSAHDGQAIVTLYLEDGRVARKTFALRAQARANVAIAQEFGPAVQDARFGAVVESVGETPAQIVVERAMYWNAGGVTWAAGTNALATRLR